MATQSMTVQKPEPTVQPCPCGCAPCDEPCCRLDCLERPRFFSGQLLTDQDLMGLLGWTQDKLRLGRFRHGWGVVCGLEVCCHPKKPGWVLVKPGYAISCCGDDIIVCEEKPFDLRDACREDKDPCAELKRPGEPTSEAEEVEFYGHSYPKIAFRAVDLYVGYREEPSVPQTALGRGVCKEVSECEYSRTREVFTLAWQPAAIGSDPVKAAAMHWHDAYKKCFEVVNRFCDFINRFDYLESHGEEVRRWLLRWIDEHPLCHFCSLRDSICRMTLDDLTNQTKLAQLLFWLLQDCRSTFLNCTCHECRESPGVPLARVWLYVAADPLDKRHCTIVSIDPYPPYRRPLKTECWPAPLGSVNVGQVIWHRWKDACTTLEDLGIRVQYEVPFAPRTVNELKDTLQHESLFVPCGRYVDVWTYDAGALGQRVVGFRPVEPSESAHGQPEYEEAPGEPTYDDFTHIDGIGTARANRLREAGIITFRDLAECSMEQLLELSLNVSEEILQRWKDEARRLAEGGA
jgi:hypothetical protein